MSMRRERFDAEQAGAGLVRRIRLGNLSSCGSTAVLIGTSGRSNGREAHSMRQTQSVRSSGEGDRRDTSDGHVFVLRQPDSGMSSGQRDSRRIRVSV